MLLCTVAEFSTLRLMFHTLAHAAYSLRVPPPGVTQVVIIGDLTQEPDEFFTVTLSSAAGANLGDANAATVTIASDDLVSVR